MKYIVDNLVQLNNLFLQVPLLQVHEQGDLANEHEGESILSTLTSHESIESCNISSQDDIVFNIIAQNDDLSLSESNILHADLPVSICVYVCVCSRCFIDCENT